MPRLVESVVTGSTSEDGRNAAVLESLLPSAIKMQRDASPTVRSSLATATGELLVFLAGLGGDGGGNVDGPPPSPGRGGGVASSPSLPDNDGSVARGKHVDDTLIPILQKLLQDSDPGVTTASLRAPAQIDANPTD